MRKLLFAAALLCPFALAGCAGGSASPIGPTAVQPDVTNDIGLACRSADGLLRLASTKITDRAIASAAASLDAGTQAFCGKAIADAPTIARALSVIDTAAAVLLGAGVAL